MSPQSIYTRATMHTYEPADCTVCGQPNDVDWSPDSRLNVQDGMLPDESCGNRECERYRKRPAKG